MLVSNYLIHERHTIDTSLIQSRYVYDTFNRYTNDTWPCDRKYGNLVHVRYIDDTKTIQKDDTSFSIRLRYWSKVCTIHITIQNTIHFLRNFSIHTRYMNDTKLTKIGSVSRARYTAQPPPKQRFCIECVSKCIEHAFARWIQLWIHVRYGYDTRSIRYDTSYRENAPWFIGKKARYPDGAILGVDARVVLEHLAGADRAGARRCHVSTAGEASAKRPRTPGGARAGETRTAGARRPRERLVTCSEGGTVRIL